MNNCATILVLVFPLRLFLLEILVDLWGHSIWFDYFVPNSWHLRTYVVIVSLGEQ